MHVNHYRAYHDLKARQATKFTRHNALVGTSTILVLLIKLEDLVVKQACERSGCVPKLLWLATDYIRLAGKACLLHIVSLPAAVQ